MKLSEADAGCYATVCSVSGSHHLISRLIGIGIVEGTMVRVIQNLKDQPVFILLPGFCNCIGQAGL